MTFLRTRFLEWLVQYLERLKGFEGSEQRLPDMVLLTKFSSLRFMAMIME